MAVALVWERRAKAARKRTKAAKRKKREVRLTTSEGGAWAERTKNAAESATEQAKTPKGVRRPEQRMACCRSVRVPAGYASYEEAPKRAKKEIAFESDGQNETDERDATCERRSGARCDETNKVEVEDRKARRAEAAKSRLQESTSTGIAKALHDEKCSGEDPKL